MVRFWRCLLILLALNGGGATVWASAETRAFDAAANSLFKLQVLPTAETNFGRFVQTFPNSPLVPAAILYQAEARYFLHQYGGAIELLTANQAKAGPLTDQYLYWIAHSHLANTNYPAAADAFGRLVETCPGSTNRLEAAVEQAAAYARMTHWNRVVDLLGGGGGAFQHMAAGVTNDYTARGFLFLTEAQVALTNYAAARSALEPLTGQRLKPGLDWRRWYLRCQIEAGESNPEIALLDTTNLLALAVAANDSGLLAETYALQGQVLQQLKRFDQAMDCYENNLSTNAPPEQQRQALLKIAEISFAQDETTNALRRLQEYWSQYPHSGVADLALLTLGELELREGTAGMGTNGVAVPGATNLLNQALGHFDTLLNTFPTSPLVGKALLDKGWCYWQEAQWPSNTTALVESEAAFRAAAEKLPPSEDLAVAWFKWGDTRFLLKDFEGAITNYRFLVSNQASIPGVKEHLIENALYQIVQAAIAVSNMPVANEAMQKALDWYPNGFAGDRTLFLVGQGYARQNDPAEARAFYHRFEERSSDPLLLPRVKLAVSRTYELEGNWTAAITNLDGWIEVFTNNGEMPRAQFSRAWDTYKAGLETNALTLFTNFVAQYPTNELTPQAQWWIGSYYFSQGSVNNGFYNAETYFQKLYTTPSFDQAFEAKMMAGRAAVGRYNYKGALDHFRRLYTNAACPPDLRVQAAFAAGDALMQGTEPDASTRNEDLRGALDWFEDIVKNYATNSRVPLVWGRIGDCNLQLKAYAAASNAYEQVLVLSNATPAARYQARLGLATVAEKLSETKTGAEQTALLNLALDYCVDVINENRDRDAARDPFSAKEAVLKAGRLAETLSEWQQAANIYREGELLLPPLRGYFEKKLLNAQEKL